MKKNLFYANKYVVAGMLLLVSGCSVGPDYKRPKMDLPAATATTTHDAAVNKLLSEKWWMIFNDPTLDALEEMALKKSYNIQLAIASIEEACAAAGVASADFLPYIGLKGGGTSIEAGGGKGGEKSDGKSDSRKAKYKVEAGISYEIDFWGKYRRANEAARANLMASHAAKEAVTLTITSEVAKIYFSLRSLTAKLAIARRTLKIREASLKVYKSRLSSGYSTELDYLRILSEVESLKSGVLSLEEWFAKTEHALSALIGASPNEMMTRRTASSFILEKLKVPSDIPSGLPSNLIERRPDVAQAEGQLIAANAQVGHLIADNFPSFSLTGAAGSETNLLKTLFDSGTGFNMYGLELGLAVFDGGRKSAQKQVAKARYKAALATYKNVVTTAFRETLDALVANRKNSQVVASKARQVNALKRSYEIAKIQKEGGLIGLIDLLDVERGLLASEMELAGALERQLTAVVDLCKALGGGWKYSTGEKKKEKLSATSKNRLQRKSR